MEIFVQQDFIHKLVVVIENCEMQDSIVLGVRELLMDLELVDITALVDHILINH